MYLTIDDLKSGVFEESLDVITRNEDNANTAIKEAIDEVNSYLSIRYKMSVEFSKSGAQRNNMTVKLVRDIAIFNCFMIANPAMMSDSRMKKYDDTIKFLKSIQAGAAQIEGLEKLTADDTAGGSTYVRFGGNKKRNNSFN